MAQVAAAISLARRPALNDSRRMTQSRSEEHTSELQSRQYLVCRLLLEKKKTVNGRPYPDDGSTDPGHQSAGDGVELERAGAVPARIPGVGRGAAPHVVMEHPVGVLVGD